MGKDKRQKEKDKWKKIKDKRKKTKVNMQSTFHARLVRSLPSVDEKDKSL